MKSYEKFNRKHGLIFCTITIAAAVICLSIVACNNGGGASGGNNNNNNNNNKPYYVSDKAPSTPQPFTDKTAKELVAGIRIGWSLGNTLDNYEDNWTLSTSISTMERAWGNPITTKENITALKNAGFNAIRIPVTWMKAADENYIIRKEWMDRVTEVVNYAADNDMYIIIDTHHDEARKNTLFKFTDAGKAEGLKAYKIMWEQIAANFKNYNDKLVFEGLNEPRTVGSSNEWGGGTASERNIINEYYQVFVDTVRASGGNNGKRILMIPTYGAHSGQAAMEGLKIPNDSVQNKIIVSIHAYVPYDFALSLTGTSSWSNSGSNATDITAPLDRAHNIFVSKGIPVIMGEFGAVDKTNESTRAQWAQFYVSYAKNKDIPCFWWDNGIYKDNYPDWEKYEAELFGIFDRKTSTFKFNQILSALMTASN